MTALALELADILRLHGPAYLARFGDSLSAQQKRALRDIVDLPISYRPLHLTPSLAAASSDPRGKRATSSRALELLLTGDPLLTSREPHRLQAGQQDNKVKRFAGNWKRSRHL